MDENTNPCQARVITCLFNETMKYIDGTLQIPLRVQPNQLIEANLLINVKQRGIHSLFLKLPDTFLGH